VSKHTAFPMITNMSQKSPANQGWKNLSLKKVF